MPLKTLVSNLRYLRFRKGFTRREVADLVGVGNRLVDAWECGRSIPQTPELEKLSQLHGITIDDLVRVDLKNERLNKFKIFMYV